jgi:hypothetical protein
MCEHKIIKLINLRQPFTGARRRHMTKVFDHSMSRLIRLYDVTGWQLCTSVAPPFLLQLANVVPDVISVCVKLLVAAGKWQNSGSIVFSVVADVIPL